MPDRQSSLEQVVDELAGAIAAGDCDPAPLELEALAALCDRANLKPEAERVRRWLGGRTNARQLEAAYRLGWDAMVDAGTAEIGKVYDAAERSTPDYYQGLVEALELLAALKARGPKYADR